MKIPSFFTENEIALAYYLTKMTFKNKNNIAKNFDKEFILWFAGKRDINKAIQFVFSKGKPSIDVKLYTLTLPLDWKRIERISLSRL